MTSAKEGEKVYATPTSNNGYILTNILVDGTKPTLESDGKRYSFTMPSKDVEVTAQFEPVDLILKSNMSGNASYSGSAEGKVTVNVKPSAAYSVKSISVTDAGGKKLSVSKRQSGAYIYEFDITKMSKAPCTVDIQFKKQNKKQAVDTSKTNIKDSIDELSKSSDAVQKSINTIKNIVQKTRRLLQKHGRRLTSGRAGYDCVRGFESGGGSWRNVLVGILDSKQPLNGVQHSLALCDRRSGGGEEGH